MGQVERHLYIPTTNEIALVTTPQFAPESHVNGDDHERRVAYLKYKIRQTDPDLGDHCDRVGMYAYIMARNVHSEEMARMMQQAGELHDVGKIKKKILDLVNRPTELNDEEYAIVKKHTAIGGAITATERLNRTIVRGAKYHHENWDGTGYHGLAGDRIPLSGQVLKYVDVFDSLTQDRPYRGALSVEEAINYIRPRIGTHFSPTYEDAFFEMVRWYTDRESHNSYEN